MRPPGRASRRQDDGQAVVELALGLPLLVAMALGVVQVAMVVRHRLAVQEAARLGARAASVSANPVTAARSATTGVGGLDAPDIEVDLHTLAATIDGRPNRLRVVTVTVRDLDNTDVPIVGVLIPDARLEAEVTMALEPP